MADNADETAQHSLIAMLQFAMLNVSKLCAFFILFTQIVAQYVEIKSPWVIRERELNFRCVVVQMSAYFKITYNQTLSGVPGIGEATIPLPADASISSALPDTHHPCVPNNNQIAVDLQFGASRHSLDIIFEKSSDIYYIKKLMFEYEVNSEQFPGHYLYNGDSLNASYDGPDFKTPLGNSYSCQAEQVFTLYGSTDQVTLYVKNLRFEVFNNRRDNSFSKHVDCDFDEHPRSALPIIVGVSVAFVVMTFVVVFVYIRTRSKRRPKRNDLFALIDR